MARPKTGRTSKLVRVPNDCNHLEAIRLYYEVSIVLEHWREEASTHDPSEPRWANVIKLIEQIGHPLVSTSSSDT